MSEKLMKKNGPVVEKDMPHSQVPRRATFTPRVDVLELPTEMVLVLDMPGVKAGDVDLQYERGELTVSGKRQPAAQSGRALVEEFEAGDYRRVFLVSQD